MEGFKEEKRKIGKWDAIIYVPKESDSDLYIIMLNDIRGGAIVSDVNLLVAEKKFIEAMDLAESAYKLIDFSENGTFPLG